MPQTDGPLDLEGKLAVVTGASSGIGRSLALALAGRGTRLALVGRDEERLSACAAAADQTGASGVTTHSADLTDDDALERLIGELTEEPGIDVLVHAAAVLVSGEQEATPLATYDHQHRLNARAPFRLTQALLGRLEAVRGQVVFVNSSAGFGASAGYGPYAATKHALRALADSLRDEVNARGIRVLSVYPGRTATPMMEALMEERYEAERLLQPEDVAAMVVAALTLPATAEVTDLHIRPMLKAR